MSIKIINYNDINKLDKHKEYDLIKKSLHICAAASTTRGMYNRYGKDFKMPILSIGDITSSIVGDWDDSVVKLGQYTSITRYIKELNEQLKSHPEYKTKYERLLKGMRRNQKEIQNAIRSLVECNIFPHEFEPVTEEEKIFLALWSNMESNQNDKSIYAFRNEIFENFNKIEEFKYKFIDAICSAIDKQLRVLDKGNKNSKICDMLKQNKKQIKEEEIKVKDLTFVLHGFYYIRPIQDRVIELMQKIGIELIFLNWYDEKYSEVFKIWGKTFDERWGYPNSKEWINDSNKDDYRWCDLFADIYEGEVNQKDLNKIKEGKMPQLKCYDNSIEFINDYKNPNNMNDNYYSPESHKMDDILKDYFPEKFKNRHFLSYPIGQFLYEIHKMWDEDSYQLKIDIDCLQQCFTSGWLSAEINGKKENSKDYIYDLYLIKTYFKNCESINQWQERLNLLKTIKSEVVNSLNTDKEKEDKNYRFHQSSSNPFMKFSFFKIDESRIEAIIKFIEELIKEAKFLFSDNQEIKLSEYMKKIDNVIKRTAFEDLNEVEEQIVENLKKTMLKPLKNEVYCYPEDIAGAIILFLGGDFEKNEDNNREKGNDGIIQPIEKIEGASISYRSDACVHICQISEDGMPGNNRSYPWPLNKENVKRINTSRDYSNRLLDRMKLIYDETGSINRYLFYCALQSSENIKFSWIKNWEDKVIDQSVYIKLLSTWVEQFKKMDESYTVDLGEKYEIHHRESTSLTKDEIEKLSRECIEEYKICPRRFYYSYITNDFPTFTSDFHHGFVFTNVIKSISAATQSRSTTVYKQVEQFFPQWNNIQKMQLKEYSDKFSVVNNNKYDSFDGVSYISARELPNFLIPKYHDLFNKDSYTDKIISENTRLGIFKATPEKGEKCTYCPHKDYCSLSILPLDKEDEE